MPTVLITGANRGLGLEFARQYAAEGWQVIGTCRDPDAADALRSLPGTTMQKLELANLGAIAAMGRRLAAVEIDVLIANAGVMSTPYMTAEAIDEEAWLTDFRINVVAQLACAAAFLPAVARSAQKKMVAISTGVASIADNSTGGKYAYRSSKAALNAAWRSFAIDHPQVIAALLVPGQLRTDMTRYDAKRWPKLPEPAQNVAGLRKVIADLTPEQSGTFLRFDGAIVPW